VNQGDDKPCLQAWPSGLNWGILIECERRVHAHAPGHSGKHMNKEHAMEWWGGKLSPAEEALATTLRERSS
jgi:hypothetical protein